MTKQEIQSGMIFTAYGLPYDLQYNAQSEKLELIINSTVAHTSEFVTDDKAFTAFLPVFGVMQPIEIAYSYCETKTA